MSDEIFRALGRIEGAIEAIKGDNRELKSDIKEFKKAINENFEVYNKRLNSVEWFKLQALTVAGVVAGAVTFIWDIVKNKFGA